MFTGIIEEIGTIRQIQNGRNSAVLTVGIKNISQDMHIGDSIAVNGVCLTVTDFGADYFRADVMHETLERSSLGYLKTGDGVNLERAMAANGRFGGHIVSGHIDGTGTIVNMVSDDIAIRYTVRAADRIIKYIVEKGSVAIDGISLTVTDVSQNTFGVSVIPHTQKQTTLFKRKIGDVVNLENDIVGKYVERFLSFGKTGETAAESKITKEFLAKFGF